MKKSFPTNYRMTSLRIQVPKLIRLFLDKNIRYLANQVWSFVHITSKINSINNIVSVYFGSTKKELAEKHISTSKITTKVKYLVLGKEEIMSHLLYRHGHLANRSNSEAGQFGITKCAFLPIRSRIGVLLR